MKDYVQKFGNGAYRLTGTRVSLDSVVYAFLRGESAEQIVENFPSLTLNQVYGAITFYLENREEIDQYLEQGEVESEKLTRELRDKNADLIAHIKKAREKLRLVHR